jgi:hypothetical protein
LDTERAARVLGALAEARDPGANADEIDALVQLGDVEAASAVVRSALAANAANLESARAAVREQRRALDLAWGPRSGPSLGSGAAALATAQTALRTAVEQLEAGSLAQSALAALVPNAGTGSYLSLTMTGRQSLADLGAWRARFGVEDLRAFEDRIMGMRQLLASWVGQAIPVADALDDVDVAQHYRWGHAAVRAAALMLLARGGETYTPDYFASRVTYFYRHASGRTPTPSDGLMLATVLAASAPVATELDGAFLTLRNSLGAGTPFSGSPQYQLDLAAASLAELAVQDDTDPVARMGAMASTAGSTDPLAIALLVRSGYAPTDASVRFRAATGALQALGYRDGSIPTSAAVLAVSPVPTAEFSGRLSQLDPWARAAFPTAPIAAALLASLPLAPAEALLFQKYAMGEVAAGSFFDETPEIDYLALLVSTGMVTGGGAAALFGPPTSDAAPALAPLAGPGGGWTVAPSAPLPSNTPALAAVGVGAVILSVLFAGQAYWLYQSYLDYTRQHPVHSNSVPIYG